MDEGTSSEAKKGSKQSLPEGAVAILKAWMLSPEHFAHPYPTPQEQIFLMQQTGIDKKQLKNCKYIHTSISHRSEMYCCLPLQHLRYLTPTCTTSFIYTSHRVYKRQEEALETDAEATARAG